MRNASQTRVPEGREGARTHVGATELSHPVGGRLTLNTGSWDSTPRLGFTS